MSEFTTSLDQALDRLRRGEAPATILADYPAQVEAMSELLTTALALDTLRQSPLPDAVDLVADREQFWAELAQLPTPGVSVGPLVRLKKWIAQSPLHLLVQTYLNKEQRRMNAVLVKAMLILTLVFGAGSGAAVTSAHSLPGEPLYPLKIGLEEVRLALTTDPVQQASQWQERVRERAIEITWLARNGQSIGEAELARLQTQTQTCLRQLANLPEPALEQQLEQFQQMTQQQQQLLEQASGEQVQAAVQTMTQARQAATDGLADPTTFRYRYGQHRPDEAPPQPTPVPGSGRQATPPAAPPATLAPTVTPVRPIHTPQPTGDAHRYGPQPTQPGPGQPGGNPEGQNTPTGDAHRYGPQPTQPGPGQPGGNPEATCTPTGDANRYGPQPATPQPGGNSDGSGGSGNSGDSNGSSDSGGSDNSGGSGGSSDSGGGSGDSGGSSDSGSSSDSSGSSGGSGDSGSSGGGRQ